MLFTSTNFILRTGISPIFLSCGASARAPTRLELLRSRFDRSPARIAKLGVLAFHAHQRTHGRHRYTLARARAWSETSAFGAFDTAAPSSAQKSGRVVHRADT